MRTAAIILLCCLLAERCDASHRHLLQQRSTLSGEPGVLARAFQRDRAVLRAQDRPGGPHLQLQPNVPLPAAGKAIVIEYDREGSHTR